MRTPVRRAGRAPRPVTVALGNDTRRSTVLRTSLVPVGTRTGVRATMPAVPPGRTAPCLARAGARPPDGPLTAVRGGARRGPIGTAVLPPRTAGGVPAPRLAGGRTPLLPLRSGSVAPASLPPAGSAGTRTAGDAGTAVPSFTRPAGRCPGAGGRPPSPPVTGARRSTAAPISSRTVMPPRTLFPLTPGLYLPASTATVTRSATGRARPLPGIAPAAGGRATISAGAPIRATALVAPVRRWTTPRNAGSPGRPGSGAAVRT